MPKLKCSTKLSYMLSLEALHGKVNAAHMGAFMTNAINGLELFEAREVSLNEPDINLAQVRFSAATLTSNNRQKTAVPFGNHHTRWTRSCRLLTSNKMQELSSKPS